MTKARMIDEDTLKEALIRFAKKRNKNVKPTIEAPVKTGKWIREEQGWLDYKYHCSACGQDALCGGYGYDPQYLTDYCPHCGAKMESDN